MAGGAGEVSRRLADDEPGRPGQCPGAADERRVRDTGALYAQAQATRERSVLLAGRLQATQRQARENWQLVLDAWGRAEQIRAGRPTAPTDPRWLRYSAYARLQARLASMPVIEQAKGIIMAQNGWLEDQAFEALRRVSQRENIKVCDLAASIVARAAGPAPARRPASPAPARRPASPAPARRPASPAPARRPASPAPAPAARIPRTRCRATGR